MRMIDHHIIGRSGGGAGRFGEAFAIFTRNGHAARELAARVNVGMVGISVPIPMPLARHSFGGWKRSGFGDHDRHGLDGVRFWTRVKTVARRWPDGDWGGSGADLPRGAEDGGPARIDQSPAIPTIEYV